MDLGSKRTKGTWMAKGLDSELTRKVIDIFTARELYGKTSDLFLAINDIVELIKTEANPALERWARNLAERNETSTLEFNKPKI